MLKNKFGNLLILSLFALLFVSCEKTVTYSEMKEKEREAVSEYIKRENIRIISFSEFIANDSTTDVGRNEYVEIDDVYMQIVNNPIKTDPRSRPIHDGENVDMLATYDEYNIQSGTTVTSNLYATDPEELRISNNSGSYTATFTSGMMYNVYGSSVPTGWLVPLRFLTFNRRTSNLAKVKLIVPHTKGTSTAATYVYPCLYEITFQPADPQFENNF